MTKHQNAGPLVSCLCVTRNRVALLQRAIACFNAQTYPDRELVVVYEEDDPLTRNYLASLSNPMIRPVNVGVSPKLTLGALRNLAIRHSRGDYFAQWDDDDWHAPERLAQQLAALRAEEGVQACALARWIIYDAVEKRAYLSATRYWEGSIVAVREGFPAYADLPRGEDASVLESLIKADKIIGIDNPRLYIYTCHGANTWEREHWEKNILPYCQPLPDRIQQWARVLVG